MQRLSKVLIIMSVAAVLLRVPPASAARPECGNGICEGNEKSTCPDDCPAEVLDVPVCAALGDPPVGSEAGIFNDTYGPYCHSLSQGIYAYFQHETGDTSDLWVSLIDSDRVFLVDFAEALSSLDDGCIPSDWIDGATTGWRIFVDEVDNVPVEGDVSGWADFCADSHQTEYCDRDDEDRPYVRRRGVFFLNDTIKKVTFELRFQVADWQDFDVNDPMVTSWVKVYHPSSETWVIEPELVGTDAIANLLRFGRGRNNTASCGYFSMPFEMVVTKLPAPGP